MRPTATMCSYFGLLVQFGINSVTNATISPTICLTTRGSRFERTGCDCVVAILTHWGQVTHICVGKLTIIGSSNSLSPGQRQAIIWTNAAMLLTGPLETNLSEVSIGSSNIFIQTNAFENVVREMASIFTRPQCVNLSQLNSTQEVTIVIKPNIK